MNTIRTGNEAPITETRAAPSGRYGNDGSHCEFGAMNRRTFGFVP